LDAIICDIHRSSLLIIRIASGQLSCEQTWNWPKISYFIVSCIVGCFLGDKSNCSCASLSWEPWDQTSWAYCPFPRPGSATDFPPKNLCGTGWV